MRNFQDVLDVRDWAGAGILLESFAPPEDGFVWQMGRWGEIVFDFDDLNRSKASVADLMVELDVFKHPPDVRGQDVFFYLNGLRVGSFHVIGRRIVIMSFPVSALRAKNNVLTIDTPGSISPRNFGSDDGRVLGAAIFAVYFRREQ